MGIPLPAGAVLISPWVDMTHSFKSVMTNTKTVRPVRHSGMEGCQRSALLRTSSRPMASSTGRLRCGPSFRFRTPITHAYVRRRPIRRRNLDMLIHSTRVRSAYRSKVVSGLKLSSSRSRWRRHRHAEHRRARFLCKGTCRMALHRMGRSRRKRQNPAARRRVVKIARLQTAGPLSTLTTSKNGSQNLQRS
jgi:hypothetical protein